MQDGRNSRAWDTCVGTMDLHIPKLREGSYLPSLLEPRRRSERALLAVIYGRKPWRKPNSATIITRPDTSMRGPTGPLPQIAAKVFTLVHKLRGKISGPPATQWQTSAG